jgi:hypothetical protein
LLKTEWKGSRKEGRKNGRKVKPQNSRPYDVFAVLVWGGTDSLRGVLVE